MRRAHHGRQPLVKEAKTFVKELGITRDLSFSHPKGRDITDGADIPRDKTKRHPQKASLERQKTEERKSENIENRPTEAK